MGLTIKELKDEISQHLQDPSNRLLNRDSILEFINSAAWDAANQDWLISIEEDESLTLVADTYDYTVPSGFAYIDEVWIADSSGAYLEDNMAKYHEWWLVLDGAATVLRFSQTFFTIPGAYAIKLVGQARPTAEYSSDSTEIDAGLESFIRERAVAYAARHLARHGGDHAARYAALEQEALTFSDNFLQHQGERFQPKHYGRMVPGR